MLRLLAIAATVVNVMFGLAVGADARRACSPGSACLPRFPSTQTSSRCSWWAPGLAFIPAVRDPRPYRFYLWVVGAGVKLVVAGLFLRVWIMGLTPWSILVGVIVDGGIGAGFVYCLLKGK